MKIAGIKFRRRFFVGLGLVVAVTGIWVYWSRSNLPQIGSGTAGQPGAFVRIAGEGQGISDKLMEERAEYFDPTPLFLPTAKNFQQRALPARVVKQPGQVFRDFDPKTNFAESALPDYGAVDEATGNSLPEVLGSGNVAPFAGFGRVDPVLQPLARRGCCIEIKSLKDGVLSVFESLNDPDLPQVENGPVEFIVGITSAGLLGDPVVVSGSGKDEVDAKLKDYLVSVYRIGERLLPGRYEVLIGP